MFLGSLKAGTIWRNKASGGGFIVIIMLRRKIVKYPRKINRMCCFCPVLYKNRKVATCPLVIFCRRLKRSTLLDLNFRPRRGFVTRTGIPRSPEETRK